MARLRTVGFEVAIPALAVNTNDELGLDGYGTGSTAPVRDTSVFRSGAASAKCSGTSANTSYLRLWTTGGGNVATDMWGRFYFRVSALPSSLTTIAHFGATTGPTAYQAQLDSTGKLKLAFNGTQIGSDSAATIATNTWYRVEMLTRLAFAGDDQAELKLDGTVVATDPLNARQASSSLTYFEAGWLTAPGNTTDMYIDDVAVNSDSGTAQNGYPGEGKVVLLTPTSDNARAAWVGGVGGTTNLYDAVDNIPPAGHATETNTTQIEHPGGGSGSDRFDANMTTYTAAGIASGDTITLLHPFINHGEDIATGTKTLSFLIVSNPAGSFESVFTAGGDAGALGTWPAGWRTRWGTSSVVYSPSVTLGTAPVLGVERPETASRVASVDFMGVYVEYTAPTGNTYTQSVTGGVSFSGGTARLPQKGLTGTSTFSGSLSPVKQAGQLSQVMTATLSFVGAVSKRTQRALTGGLTFSGSLTRVKAILRSLTGTLQFNNYRQAVLSLSPVNYHRFGESSGTVAADEVAGNNGTIVNSPTLGVAAQPGMGGNTAITFNGTNQYVVVTGTTDPPSAMSVALWFKSNTVGSFDVLASRGNFNNTGWAVYANNGATHLQWVAYGLTSIVAVGPNVSPFDGNWHMFVGTYDGARIKAYIDATLGDDWAATGTITATAENLKYAAILDQDYYAGTLDEPAVFHSALTQAQITSLYNLGLGVLKRQGGAVAILKSLNASLSFGGGGTGAGAFLSNAFNAAFLLAGAANPLQAVKQAGAGFTKTFTATVSFTGAIIRQTRKGLTGTVSFSGAVGRVKSAFKTLTGTVSFTTTRVRQANRALSGTVSFSGAVSRTKVALKSLAGTVSFAGQLSKRVQRSLSASLSFAGSVAKGASRALTGSVSFSGATAKGAFKNLAGSVTFSGTVTRIKVALKSLTGTLSFTVSRAGQALKSLTAAVSFGGALTRTRSASSQVLTAALSFSTSLLRASRRSLAGSVNFSGLLTRQTNKFRTATLSFTGSVTRQRQRFRSLTATVSFAGNLARVRLARAYTQALEAGVSFTAGTTRRLAKTFSGSVSFSGLMDTFSAWMQVQVRAIPSIITLIVRYAFRALQIAPTNRISMRVVGPLEVAYKRGTNIKFEAVFTDENGNNFDPAAGTAKLYVKLPDGNYKSGYARPTGLTMTQISSGVYHGDVQTATTDPVGQYEVETECVAGGKTFLDSIKINVRA